MFARFEDGIAPTRDLVMIKLSPFDWSEYSQTGGGCSIVAHVLINGDLCPFMIARKVDTAAEIDRILAAAFRVWREAGGGDVDLRGAVLIGESAQEANPS